MSKILKAHNAQVHYKAKHASLYDSLTGDERATKLARKVQEHEAQQKMMKKPSNRNEMSVMDSIKISYLLSKHGK